MAEDIIDGMEEFFLRGFFACDELHIVNHQQVCCPQPRLETKCIARAHRTHKIEHEAFRRHVERDLAGVGGVPRMANGLQNMGFALARLRMNEEGVAQRIAPFGQRLCRTRRDHIGRSADISVKSITWIKRAGLR